MPITHEKEKDYMIEGCYITAERVTKALRLRLTDKGRELLDCLTLGTVPEVQFTEPHADILRKLVEDLEACADLHMLTDDEYELVGALTSSPIIVTKPRYDHEHDDILSDFDAVFWFPNYQIESELETLLRTGEVMFDLASDPQQVYTCDCGFETYDSNEIQSHKCKAGVA